MAEEAKVPTLAPAVSDRNCSRKSPASDSSPSTSQDASQQQCPSIHPSTAPAVMPLQNPDQSGHGPGLYAIPTFLPFMGIMSGSPPSTLIPLTYKIPTRANSTGTAGEVQGQEARHQQGPQRQVVVRRFHFAIQLDLALIIKLAAVVFLFSQEGSRQRFILLVLFASFIYLYQTGALAPLLRWIRRGGAHPQPHPAVRPEQRPLVLVDGNQPLPEGNLQVENDNQLAQNGLPPAEVADENQPALLRQDGNQRWGILKEIQMNVLLFDAMVVINIHRERVIIAKVRIRTEIYSVLVEGIEGK